MICLKHRPTYNHIFDHFIFIVLILIAVKLAFFHFKAITYEYPLGFREGAILLNTHLLLKGGNPYDLANQPLYTNVYGILYGVAIYPFAKLFGPTPLVHRLFTGLFNAASCYIVFSIARYLKASAALALAGALILYAHLLSQGNPLISPDSLGLFLFLCSIFVPHKFDYSPPSLVASICLGILGFITKPYFILAIFYVLFYLFLFRSRKESIKYGLIVCLVCLCVFPLLNTLFETYFNNVFFIHQTVASNNFKYANQQLSFYIQQNFSLFIILVIFAFSQFFKVRSLFFGEISFKDNWHRNWRDLTQNKLSALRCLVVVCLVASLLIFYFKLGQHEGNWQVYLHHLVSPLLTVLVSSLSWNKRCKFFCTSLITINLLIISLAFEPRLNYNLEQWKTLETILSQNQNIHNSPAIVALLLKQEKPVYDGGQSEFFIHGSNRNFLGVHLPPDPEIKLRHEQYIQELTNSVKLRKFDLIVLTQGLQELIPQDLVKTYYDYWQTLPIDMAVKAKGDLYRSWNLDLYKPKSRGLNPEFLIR